MTVTTERDDANSSTGIATIERNDAIDKESITDTSNKNSEECGQQQKCSSFAVNSVDGKAPAVEEGPRFSVHHPELQHPHHHHHQQLQSNPMIPDYQNNYYSTSPYYLPPNSNVPGYSQQLYPPVVASQYPPYPNIPANSLPYPYPPSSVPVYHNSNNNTNGYQQSPNSTHSWEQKQQQPKNSWGELSTVALAISAGTALGLTAAATVRWINGDDFYIITNNTSTTVQNDSYEKTNTTTIVEDNNESDCTSPSSSPTTTNNPSSTNTTDSTLLHSSRNESQKEMDTTKYDDCDNDFNSEKIQLSAQLLSIQKALTSIQDYIEKSEDNNSTLRRGNSLTTNTNHDNISSRISNVLYNLETVLGISTREVVTEDTVANSCAANTNDPTLMSTSTEVDLPQGGTTVTHPIPSVSQNLVDREYMDLDEMISELKSSSKMELQQALTLLIRSSESIPANQFLSGIQLLYLFALNLSKHPLVPRYRRINCNNENYKLNVEPLTGAAELLSAIGFVQTEPAHQRMTKYWDWLSLSSSKYSSFNSHLKEVEEIYISRLEEVVRALEILKTPKDISTQELVHETLSAAGLDQGRATVSCRVSTSLPQKNSSFCEPASNDSKEYMNELNANRASDSLLCNDTTTLINCNEESNSTVQVVPKSQESTEVGLVEADFNETSKSDRD